jgi:hypothetical protein
MNIQSTLIIAICSAILTFGIAGCGSAREAFQRAFSGGPWAVEAGPEGEYVYWLRSHYNDTNAQQVYRTSLSDGKTELVVGGKKVLDIDIDGGRKHLYWSTKEGLILRGNLDGSESEIVTEKPPHPTRIAIDETAGTLYWMTTAAQPSYYETAMLTGGSKSKNRGLIQRVRVDTSAPLGEASLEGQPETLIRDVSVQNVSAGSLLGWLALEADTTDGSVFYGNNRTAGAGMGYFTYHSQSRNQSSQVFEWGKITMSDAGDADPRMGFAVHPGRRALYHTTEEGKIVKVPYEGGRVETLIETTSGDPTDVALGPEGETMYWAQYAFTEGATAGVYEANLNGSGKQLVVADSLVGGTAR